LDLNSRQSASQIGRKVRLSKEVVNYRINRLIDKGVIKYFYVVLNTLALGYNHYKIYFRFQNVDVEKEKELINHFVSHEDSIWVASLRGTWDLGVSLLAKSPLHFGRIYKEIIEQYGDYVLEKNILLIEKAPTFNRAYLVAEGQNIEFEYVEKEETLEIDEIDKRILAKLSINARLPITDLAQNLNLTRDIVTYRIKKLMKGGLIQGFRTSFDLEKLGYSYYKILLTFKNIKEQKEKELISYCRFNKNIVQYIKLIGNWDAEIEVEVNDDKKLHSLLLEIRNNFSDIIRNYNLIKVYEHKLNYFPFRV